MTRIERSALLPYSAEKLFDLVNDVRAYPLYMDGCVKATVLSDTPAMVEARLDLRKSGVSQSFSTRNRLERPQRIAMELLDGPFEYLQGEWLFRALASEACKISFHLEFRMQGSVAPVNRAAGKLFEGVANNLVDAVCQRAHALYARP